ncbi:MAG: hypothetical protein ACK40G_01290 [Cytophagaceae bacterium]
MNTSQLSINEPLIQTEWFDMYLKQDIIFIRYKEAVTVDLNVMKVMMESFYKLSEGKPFPILSDGRKVKYWTEEAREYQKEVENKETMKAAAILASTYIHKILFHFFVMLYKPNVPVRFFTDESKALEWLSYFKNK